MPTATFCSSSVVHALSHHFGALATYHVTHVAVQWAVDHQSVQDLVANFVAVLA